MLQLNWVVHFSIYTYKKGEKKKKKTGDRNSLLHWKYFRSFWKTYYVLLDASLLWCPENFELKDGPAGWFLGDDYRTSRVLRCLLRSYISSPQAAMEVIQQQGPIAGCEELFLFEITEIGQTLCIEGIINNQHLHTPNLDLQQKCSGHNHPGIQQKSCHQSSQVKRKCLQGAPTLQIPELYLNQVDFAFWNHPS